MSDSTESISLVQELMWSARMNKIVEQTMKDWDHIKSCQTDYEDEGINQWADAQHNQQLENLSK